MGIKVSVSRLRESSMSGFSMEVTKIKVKCSTVLNFEMFGIHIRTEEDADELIEFLQVMKKRLVKPIKCDEKESN